MRCASSLEMRVTRIVPAALALIAAASLAACSQKTQDAAANTADGTATDFNATTRNAVDDVNAATDRALGTAQNSIDDASPGLNRAVEGASNAADRAQRKTGQALQDAGNAIDR